MEEQGKFNMELAVQALQDLKEKGGFDISVCDSVPNIEDNPRYKKLSLSTAQAAQLSAVTSQLPMLMAVSKTASAAGGVSDAVRSGKKMLFLVQCPQGINETLLRIKDSTNWTNIIYKNGKFSGYASMQPVDISKISTVFGDTQAAVASVSSAQAVVAATFAAMSIATSQYYLTQINSELDTIKQGMDKILEFLYGDKRAELMAEVSFAKYAYENFSTIAGLPDQKSATIANLQSAKKVAMKDSEFYISDLASTIQEGGDIEATVQKACQIYESLDLSLQLGVMSTILEVFYSGNFDKGYLSYLESELTLYIDKCEKFVISAFAKLSERVDNYKAVPIKKVDKGKLLNAINNIMSAYNSGGESQLKKTLRDGLYSATRRAAYYLTSNGDIYVKAD